MEDFKVKQRGKGTEDRHKALAECGRIVRRWPTLTTRIIRDRDGLLYVEYARFKDAYRRGRA